LKHLLFVTGRPGIGKTSVLLHTVEELKMKGYMIGGMLSREVREKGVRIGFEIIDFYSERRGWLAHVNQPVGPKVSKYRVNLDDLNVVGAGSIRDAAKNAQIIIIDEIGPMELFSQAFREAVVGAMNSGKPLLGTIHFRAHDPIINSIRNRDDAQIIEVTYENRTSKQLFNKIMDTMIQSVKEYERKQVRKVHG